MELDSDNAAHQVTLGPTHSLAQIFVVAGCSQTLVAGQDKTSWVAPLLLGDQPAGAGPVPVPMEHYSLKGQDCYYHE